MCPVKNLRRPHRLKNRSPAPTRRSWRAAPSNRPPALLRAPQCRTRIHLRPSTRAPFQAVIWFGWTSYCCASSASVFSPLMAANATLALNAGEWVRRVRLVMVAPDTRHPRRFQAEIPLIELSKFGQPPLIPVIVARDRNGATTDAVLPKLDRVSIAAALSGVVTPANEFCCDGGTEIVAFARRAGIAAHVLPKPGKPTRQAPDYQLNNVNAYHGRLKEWLRRIHGVAKKNLPNYLCWRRTLEALGGNATSAKMILGAIGMGPYQQMAL